MISNNYMYKFLSKELKSLLQKTSVIAQRKGMTPMARCLFRPYDWALFRLITIIPEIDRGKIIANNKTRLNSKHLQAFKP